MEFDGFLHSIRGTDQLCDCRIWLPKDAGEDAIVEMWLPVLLETPVIPGNGPHTLSGKIGEHKKIAISGVWIEHYPVSRWPARLAGRSKVGLSQIDKIVESYRFDEDQQDAGEPESYSLCFGLTDCDYLQPSVAITNRHSGDVTVRVIRHFEVSYPPLGTIVFERSVGSFRQSDVRGTIYTSSLIARVVEPSSLSD